LRALTITELGARAQIAERDEPVREDGHTLVEVLAAPLNPVDVRVASGGFFMGNPPLPYVPGVEVVGRVLESDRLPAGTMVWSCLDGLGTSRDGAIADQAVLRDETLVTIDVEVDVATAAALGTAGMAAWFPLTRRAPVRPGETVVVLGATGAVGQIAIQAAKLLGAGTTVAVGRSEERLATARTLGADATVQLGEPERFVHDLRDACGPDGAHVVFDLLWGDPLVAALEVAAPHARILHIGQSAGADASVPSAPIRGKSLDVLGFTNFNVDLPTMRACYGELLEHASAGRIRLDLERVSLERAADAWDRQASGPGTKLIVCP
jgi:NADPH:quinone reductase-like Zn-dependent oxidoreductase